jgi:GNAT superfamily N-acetyltransferase
MPPKARAAAPRLTFAPATPDRWDDIETLFGPRGACAGCWCMWWKLARGEFQKNAGAGNRRAFKKLVDGGAVPGILAYDADKPVGWCAVQPKEAYASLARSRTKTVDDRPAWSVTCFFVAKEYRGRGLSLALLNAAVAHARKQGARLIEAYPIDTDKRAMDFSSFMGTAQIFTRAGFAEAARPSPNRPIMRLEIRR